MGVLFHYPSIKCIRSISPSNRPKPWMHLPSEQNIASAAGQLPSYECLSLQSIRLGPISQILPRRSTIAPFALQIGSCYIESKSCRPGTRLVLGDRELAFSYRSSARMQVFDKFLYIPTNSRKAQFLHRRSATFNA